MLHIIALPHLQPSAKLQGCHCWQIYVSWRQWNWILINNWLHICILLYLNEICCRPGSTVVEHTILFSQSLTTKEQTEVAITIIDAIKRDNEQMLIGSDLINVLMPITIMIDDREGETVIDWEKLQDCWFCLLKKSKLPHSLCLITYLQ